MAIDGEYHEVIVESFCPEDHSGRHGHIHIRPLSGQRFATHLFVEYSKSLMDPAVYPVGTKFKIRAKLTDRQGGTKFLYSHYSWKVEALSDKEAAAFIKAANQRTRGVSRRRKVNVS